MGIIADNIKSTSDTVFVSSGATAVANNLLPKHIALSDVYLLWFNIYDWIAIISFLLVVLTFLCFQLPKLIRFFKSPSWKEAVAEEGPYDDDY